MTVTDLLVLSLVDAVKVLFVALCAVLVVYAVLNGTKKRQQTPERQLRKLRSQVDESALRDVLARAERRRVEQARVVAFVPKRGLTVGQDDEKDVA